MSSSPGMTSKRARRQAETAEPAVGVATQAMRTKKKRTKPADAGWPDMNSKPLLSGETRTWAELDAALRARGTSLEERCIGLGMPQVTS